MIVNGNVVSVGQVYAFNDNEWEILSVETMSCVVLCIYGAWEGTITQAGRMTVHYTEQEYPVNLSKWVLISEPKKKTNRTTDMEFDDDIPF